MKKHNTITTRYIQDLIHQTGSTIAHINYSMGVVFESFLVKLRSDNQATFDNFTSVVDLSYCYGLKEKLEGFRDNTHHKYKKLHYTYLISRIQDRILELEKGSIMSAEDKLNHHLHEGDIGLISYASHGTSWNDLLNQSANTLLRLFSHSIFAHVGLIGERVGNSFERIHSTLHDDGGRTGVKIYNFHNYITPIKPCDLCIVRVKGDESVSGSIVDVAHQFESKKVGYNTRSAIGDITGYNALRKTETFNCGELVYHCLKTVIPTLSITKKALPNSYLSDIHLEQIYITTID